MGLIRVSNTAESKQVKDIHEHTKLNRISSLPNMRIKETRRQFSNTTWTSSVCSLIPWSHCHGPKANISKVRNAGGMVKKCNGRGWNRGQWPPK